jgi:geranylgeranyl diphosphate synthase type I
MVDEVLVGQIIDADITGQVNPSLDLIKEKTRLKTSRYTFVRPMQIGAALASKKYGKENFLEELGTKLGIAFQMTDDMLDIMGNLKNIQKTPLLDIAQHQHTFFSNFILNKASTREKKLFNEVFGKAIDKSKYTQIRDLFVSSGAILEGEKLINENFESARKLILNSEFKNPFKDKFIELIETIAGRKN